MKKGDKLKCLRTIKNFLGWVLFEKGKIYNVLHVDNESISVMVNLDHTLYANEYMEYELDWVLKNFKKL